MIRADHLTREVVKPVLRHLNLWSLAAENLILGTAAVESNMGTYLRQLGGGPAMGIWQMEPATHADIWRNYLRYQPETAGKVAQLVPPLYWHEGDEVPVDAEALIDLRYACAMARIHYRRVKAPLPGPTDWHGLEAYHKAHYNTVLGKTRPGEFIAACLQCGVIV